MGGTATRVAFGCCTQLGMFESFVHLKILEGSAWNQLMVYAKDLQMPLILQ